MSTKTKSESPRWRTIWAVAPVLAVLILTGCAAKSPEEKVAAARAKYVAELNGFVIKQEPLVVDEPIDPMEAETPAPEAEPEPEAAEGDEMAPEAGMAEVEVAQDVILDIVVRHDSFVKLPGITVDVAMQDGSQRPKGNWKIWIETESLEKGNHLQISHILEDITYQEGDGFHVEVRSPVAPEERSEYAEFASEL